MEGEAEVTEIVLTLLEAEVEAEDQALRFYFHFRFHTYSKIKWLNHAQKKKRTTFWCAGLINWRQNYKKIHDYFKKSFKNLSFEWCQKILAKKL